MLHKYDSGKSIHVPAPFCRAMTPVFMKDDPKANHCAFSVHLTEWPSGSSIDEHIHPDATEAMYLISGHGKCRLGDEEYEFEPDSMIVAAPGVVHKITNTGDELLRVLCVFSPPITAEELKIRAFAAVEKTLAADAD